MYSIALWMKKNIGVISARYSILWLEAFSERRLGTSSTVEQRLPQSCKRSQHGRSHRGAKRRTIIKSDNIQTPRSRLKRKQH